jgi:ribonuclease I
LPNTFKPSSPKTLSTSKKHLPTSDLPIYILEIGWIKEPCNLQNNIMHIMSRGENFTTTHLGIQGTWPNQTKHDNNKCGHNHHLPCE